MKIIYRILSVALALLFLTNLAPSVSALEKPEITKAKAAYVKCIETGDVLFEHGADATLYPTSTVKLMTAIVAIEALGDRREETVTVTEEMLYGVVGNRLGLKAGETVTINDLFHILITGGNNDGAFCLAYLSHGSVKNFVAKMNEKAAALGAKETHYTNPTGMHDDNMVTTLRDTAIIADYARSLPIFAEASGVSKYVMEATNKSDYRNIYNRNCLISKYYNASYYNEACSGLNAGSTDQGGHCVLTVAKDEQLSYLIIVMGAESTEDKIYSYANIQVLIDWAFKSFSMTQVIREGEVFREMPVELSSAVDYVTLAPSDNVSVFLSTDVKVEDEIEYSWWTFEETLRAPVRAGQVVGKISASRGGEVLGTCDLVVTSDVERSEFLYNLNRIEEFTSSRGFIAAVVCAVLISIGVVLFNSFKRKNRSIF